LLFLTIPPSVAVVQLIGGFRQIAEQGSGGVRTIAPFCLGIPHSLRWGAIGVLATACVAVALQTWVTTSAVHGRTSEDVPDSRSGVTAWVLATSSMLILPVAVDIHLVRGIPELVRQAVVKTLTSSELAELGDAISSQCVLAVVCGLAVGVVLVVFGAANLVAICRGRAPDWVSKYSWIVLAAAAILAGWLVVRTTADIGSLELAFHDERATALGTNR
jgi:hypothetical protein